MSKKDDLFEKGKNILGAKIDDTPLALRMRPEILAEYVGQTHILGEGKLLRRLIEADRISSLILYGPHGSGKSALAFIISRITQAVFESINATASSVNELKKILQAAQQRKKLNQKRTILFIDEIHRFNKAQQDVLISYVEHNDIILVGATTHNPFFYIISALLSRSHVFELKPLTEAELLVILKRALTDTKRGLGKLAITTSDEALRFLSRVSDGDARRALNALEIGVLTTPVDKAGKINFTIETASESIQKKIVRYDRDEDAHYDTISAFIKSMRGSDPDAALYWLAKMLYAGEDPRFIARRIVICASEDVGNADPQALMLATAAFEAIEFIGMPEARIPLAQVTVYVACAPKSNAAYMAINEATKDVEQESAQEVPEHLKDASYFGAKKLGRQAGYKYAHEFEKHFVKQEYVPKEKKYYFPTDMGFEKKIKQWLANLKTE